MTHPLLPDLPGFSLEQITLEGGIITVRAHSQTTDAPCPECSYVSSRIHGRYTRRLTDLPWNGRMVQLEIQVRRFVCLRRACSRKTFAEAIPALALRRARRTTRLADLLLKVGLALGGEAGSRLDRGVEHDHKASQAQQDKRQTLALYALHLCIASHTDHQVPPENETGQMLPIR